MKAILVHPGPQYSVSDVYQGWLTGLRQCGVQAAEYNLHERLTFYNAAEVERDGAHVRCFSFEEACQLAVNGLEAACYEYDPDLVVVVSGFFVTERLCQLIRAHGTQVALIHTESPYEDDIQAERALWVDANVINDPMNIGHYPDSTVYLPHCYDPALHHPAPATKGMESEFCFVGTGYQSRIDFLEQVDWTGIDVALAGNWKQLDDGSPLLPFLIAEPGECMDNVDTVERYCSALTSANLYRKEAERPELSAGWACGPREVELAACGKWFLRDARPESDMLFPMLPSFDGPDDFGDKIRWAIANPDKREKAARLARRAVADRTFDKNARHLLQEIEARRPSASYGYEPV